MSSEKAKEIAINKFIHFIDNKLYLTKKDANNFLIINSMFLKLICIYSLNDRNRLLAKKVRSLALKSTEINIYKLSQLGLKPTAIAGDAEVLDEADSASAEGTSEGGEEAVEGAGEVK